MSKLYVLKYTHVTGPTDTVEETLVFGLLDEVLMITERQPVTRHGQVRARRSNFGRMACDLTFGDCTMLLRRTESKLCNYSDLEKDSAVLRLFYPNRYYRNCRGYF